MFSERIFTVSLQQFGLCHNFQKNKYISEKISDFEIELPVTMEFFGTAAESQAKKFISLAKPFRPLAVSNVTNLLTFTAHSGSGRRWQTVIAPAEFADSLIGYVQSRGSAEPELQKTKINVILKEKTIFSPCIIKERGLLGIKNFEIELNFDCLSNILSRRAASVINVNNVKFSITKSPILRFTVEQTGLVEFGGLSPFYNIRHQNIDESIIVAPGESTIIRYSVGCKKFDILYISVREKGTGRTASRDGANFILDKICERYEPNDQSKTRRDLYEKSAKNLCNFTLTQWNKLAKRGGAVKLIIGEDFIFRFPGLGENFAHKFQLECTVTNINKNRTLVPELCVVVFSKEYL